jgi:signal transduction histidine kinase
MLEELSLHILDIAMNSLAAGAKTLEVSVLESTKRDWLILRIRDDGAGMGAATLDQVLERRITTKTNRKKNIGLGMALLRQTSEMCDGQFHVKSAPGQGTSVTASMRLSHIDRPPLGDLSSTIRTLSAANPQVDVRLYYHTDQERFHFSSQESKSKERQNP